MTMFDHKPSQEELAKWFYGFKLHKGLEHKQYVGGIVVIENKDRGKTSWVPYVNATSRIAYFWDWVDVNGHLAFIEISEPTSVEIELPNDRKSRQFYITAEVVVEKEIDGAQRLEGPPSYIRTVRKATGRKQVATTKLKRGWDGKPDIILPDSDSLMKAETGAVARALGTLGMLALPGSGLATAEDMSEYLSDRQEKKDKPKTKAVPNPKTA